MPNENIICDVCGKEFTSTFASFRRHLRYKHNITENVKYNVKCKEPSCDFTCSKLENLRQHLEVNHHIAQEVDELHFENIEEFHKWKLAEEKRCVTNWLKRRVMKKPTNATIYYYCNRSGRRRLISADQRKRRIKKHGSRKIDFVCTSTIIVKVTSEGIMVKYFKNHYGHDNKVVHVPLSAEEKNLIASQLIQGLTTTEILNKIKENADTNPKQASQVTRKAINNIIREYNLCDTSVELDESKIANKYRTIRKSHLMAANSTNMLAVKFEDGWILLSEDQSYSVKSNEIDTDHLCKLQCAACSSCVHRYSCTCMDFIVHNNMCKHIHKVCMIEANEKLTHEEENTDMIQEEIKMNINSILLSDWEDITDQITLNTLSDHLTSALNLISCGQNSRLTPEDVIADMCLLKTGAEEQIEVPAQINNQTQFVRVEEPSTSCPNYCLIMPPPVTGKVNDVTSDCKRAEMTRILSQYRPIVPANIILNNISQIPCAPILTVLPSNVVNI